MSVDHRLAALELRNATVTEVRYPDRIIDLIAVPYDTPAIVPYRGEVWMESFERGSFDGIEERSGKVRVNREHRKGDTVGKVVSFDPSRPDGLVASIRIVNSPEGDHVLALADEDMISASVGFRLQRGSDQELDRRSSPPRRIIRRAFVDHVALVEDPAYDRAGVLAVRGGDEVVENAASLPKLETPALDEVVEFLRSRKTSH